MTGIVVVSHSRALADAAVALASEMVPAGEVRIEVAAGLDENTLGTDATAIVAAVEAADDGDGVVILMDLGSAVLSAELALDLVDPSLAERVVLCPAPIVEGLVVAVVTAAGGGSPEAVAAEAESALLAKQSQIAEQRVGEQVPNTSVLDADQAPAQPSHRGSFVTRNRHGLHARPAARLVQETSRFDSELWLRNLTTSSEQVSARSLSRVATLGALRGHEVEVTASGPDAKQAVEAIEILAERCFDEAESSEPLASLWRGSDSRPLSTDGPLAASPGIAIGPAWPLDHAEIVIPNEPSAGSGEERARLNLALDQVRVDTERIRDMALSQAGSDEASIFDAHLLLLSDVELLDEVRAQIDSGYTAPQAWTTAAESLARRFESLTDPYLRERATDVRAVDRAVVAALVGQVQGPLEIDGILIADDLTPAQVASLDTARVTGIILAAGSPTGHSAILAKARGIPTVVCAGEEVLVVPAGTAVALDGRAGVFVVNPDPQVVTDFRDRASQQSKAAEAAHAAASKAASTGDGLTITVAANLGSIEDARVAAGHGADAAGLVRTEFLFLGRDAAPDVDEQVAVYRGIAEALGGRRITFRTLDVGGDKPLPYAAQTPEDNPFLGVRGIRFALAEETLLRDQLDAVVQVAHETPVSVMFPMVSTLDELAEAQRRLGSAIVRAGRGTPSGLQVGIMVEVPSVAMKASTFVPYVDFFSIGTNDLTQYAMAAERGNPALAALADPLDPGVLGLVYAVCQAAAGGPLVAMCGELAGDEAAIPLLIALGVRELSMAPRSVPAAKQAIRAIDVADDTELAKRAMAAPGAADVRALIS